MNNPLDPTLRDLNACGCCSGISPQTPVANEPRPGLDAIPFRAGTHAQFKASMLAGLTDLSRPALARLRTRDDGDFSIALIDGWAMIADVLCFYNERLANESFLRTATERRSLLELARQIAYELKPGVAASTWLVFTVDDSRGSPGYANVEAGTKVQSLPGPGELPQTFETVESIYAHKSWNLLQPRFTEIAPLTTTTDSLWLEGTATNLKVGDALLIAGKERREKTRMNAWDFRLVKAIQTFPNDAPRQAYTIVTLDRPLGSKSPPSTPAQADVAVFAMRQRAALFGHNAPDWTTIPDTIRNRLGPNALDWPGLTLEDLSKPPPGTDAGIGLTGEYFHDNSLRSLVRSRTDTSINFHFNAGQPPVSGAGGSQFSMRWRGWIQPKSTGTHTFTVTADDGVRLWVNDALLIDQWKDQAPTDYSADVYLKKGEKYSIRLEYYNNAGPGTIKLFWKYPGLATNQIVPTQQLYPVDIQSVYLDAVYPAVLPGMWVVLSAPQWQELYSVVSAAADSRTGFTLSSSTTCLTIDGINLLEQFNDKIRQTSVYLQGDELARAEQPSDATKWVSGSEIILDSILDIPLPPGRTLLIRSQTDAGQWLNDIATVRQIEQADSTHTRIVLTGPLINTHLASRTLIYGNVAFATHGETVNEVLGSGDATQPNQKFALRQGPLTFTPAKTETGGESTLQLWVNGVQWTAVSTLYVQGRRDRVHVDREISDGIFSVTTGDGWRGARLPTGRENIRAVYRKGIGLAGLLKADQLSLLMTRPLGVKSVTNPLPTEGAADPQTPDDARINAPITVLTLDRVVSLQDYEDFSRAFAGIGKAMAIWMWNVHARAVFLTVAGSAPAPHVSDTTLATLIGAISERSNPLVTVIAKSYSPLTFTLAGTVFVKALYDSSIVESAVKAALIGAFSFDARALGQGVAQSEVLATIQNVDGVAFIELDAFYLTTQPASRQTYLPAHAPRNGAALGSLEPAELLTLDESSLPALEVRTL